MDHLSHTHPPMPDEEDQTASVQTFKRYIREAEEVKNTASLAFSLAQHATDGERSYINSVGMCYRGIVWKANFPRIALSFRCVLCVGKSAFEWEGLTLTIRSDFRT